MLYNFLIVLFFFFSADGDGGDVAIEPENINDLLNDEGIYEFFVQILWKY